MRREDGRQAYALPADLVQDGPGLGAVDDRGLTAGAVDDEVGVVVLELRDGNDVHGASGISLGVFGSQPGRVETDRSLLEAEHALAKPGRLDGSRNLLAREVAQPRFETGESIS